MNQPAKLWGGRFTAPSSAALSRLSRSPERYFDMAPYDLAGTRAHVGELHRAGLLDATEHARIVAEIDAITADFLAGKVPTIDADEDVHTFLERIFVERLGALGGKIRAGRSRNDQAANDLRLYMRDKSRTVAVLIRELVDALMTQAERYIETPVPGFTHLQPAQPVVFGHQLLAHVQPLLRNLDRLAQWDERTALSPLGAAALAGSTFAMDPQQSAEDMGYHSPMENSIDAVGSRDAVIEFLFVCSITMIDISRLCEELTLWSSRQFGWVRLDDAYCTGSSIMPQKKNPDIAEIARGRAARLLGDLTGMMATVKALPLAYNRDLMGDKHAVFEAIDCFELALPAISGMVATFEVNEQETARQAIDGYTLATEAADWVARAGVPFSEAHEIAGAMVRYAEERGIELHEIAPEELAGINPALTPDILPALTVDAALKAHSAYGGTAPDRVREQLARARARADSLMEWVDDYSGPRFPNGSTSRTTQPSTTEPSTTD